MAKVFPMIDLVATGKNIARLRKDRGLTVRDLQNWFGFEEPQAIYKWQKGKSLPTVDNLYALGALLDVPMEDILVPCKSQLNMVKDGQQAEVCCPPLLPSVLRFGSLRGGFILGLIHQLWELVLISKCIFYTQFCAHLSAPETILQCGEVFVIELVV